MTRAGHILAAYGLAAVMFSAALVMPASGSGVFFQNYLVVRDQGQEVLCEPYRVKPNDFLLKLLREKGEIAYHNFSKFIEIFRRLNPHVPNVDLIRPGQDILIPLKIMAKDVLAGKLQRQIAIPFVTLENLAVPGKTITYRVRPGDRVWSLIAQRFGGSKSQSFDSGLRRFKQANPQLADINKILVGQRLQLPVPWPVGHVLGTASEGSLGGADAIDGRFVPSTESLAEVQKKLSATALSRICSTLKAPLMARGTYYFPRTGQVDLALDTSRFPVIDLNGMHLVCTTEPIEEKRLAAVRNFWPDVRVVHIRPESSVAQILDAISDPDVEGQEHHVVVTDGKISVSITARWQLKSVGPPSEQMPTFINMLQPREKPADPGIIRFLARRGIRVRQIWPDGQPAFAVSGVSRVRAGHLVRVQDGKSEQLVRELVAGLGARLEAHVPVTFPYAGVQVKALCNLVVGAPGGDCLVDFGDLYGDAAKAIQKTGIRIVSILPGTAVEMWVKRLLATLGFEFKENPEFSAAPHANGYTARVSVAGLLVSRKDGAKVLLVSGPLPDSVADFLKNRGLTVISVASPGSANGKESVQ